MTKFTCSAVPALANAIGARVRIAVKSENQSAIISAAKKTLGIEGKTTTQKHGESCYKLCTPKGELLAWIERD